MEQIYTLQEVADILKLTERTIYTYVYTGKLKGYKFGNKWRIKESDLQAFFDTNTPKPVKID